MKVAVPIWKKRVSPVFDSAQRILVVEHSHDMEIARVIMPAGKLTLRHRVERMAALHVDVLVCGAISKPFTRMILSAGIEVIPFIAGSVEEVLDAYFSKRLKDPRYFMPGSQRFHLDEGLSRLAGDRFAQSSAESPAGLPHRWEHDLRFPVESSN